MICSSVDRERLMVRSYVRRTLIPHGRKSPGQITLSVIKYDYSNAPITEAHLLARETLRNNPNALGRIRLPLAQPILASAFKRHYSTVGLC